MSDYLQYKNCLLTLAAIDFDSLVNFYRKLLGIKPHYYLPNRYAEFELSGLRLGIFSPKNERKTEFNNSLGSSMSLCFEVENLAEAIAYLTGMGYPPSREIMTASHGREIYAYDPAGNRLILHQSFPFR